MVSGSGEVFCDVYKPKSARALLEEELQMHDIPDEAVKALVHKLYAERAMRAGKLDEAHSLLTMALNTCGVLRPRWRRRRPHDAIVRPTCRVKFDCPAFRDGYCRFRTGNSDFCVWNNFC